MEAGTIYGFSQVYSGANNQFYIKRHSNSATGSAVITLNRDNDNATFAGNVSGTTATFTTFSGDLNGTINTATTAVTKGNAVNDTTVATTAFVQNVIGTIPAGLVFQGTWNASTNTPTLASGTGTTGHFYIVSVAGSTNLDGVTDWEVGDWAVFIEQGASDQWEKIDNSSVLGGSGSGGSLAAWAGSGTSVTLTNAPVTYSGNDTTFAGQVLCDTNTTTPTSGDAAFYKSSAGAVLSGYQAILETGSAGSRATALTINNSQNATFAGNVGIGVAAHATASLNITNANQHIRLNNGSELGIITLDSNGKLDLWAHGDGETIDFRTGTGSGVVAMSVVGTNVGIGTDSPSFKLDISNTTFGDQLRLHRSSVASGGFLTLSANDSAGNKQDYAKIGAIVESATSGSEDGALVFQTSLNSVLTEGLRLTSGGKVGISTTNAIMPLTIKGDVSRNAIAIFNSGSGTEEGILYWYSSDETTIRAGISGNENGLDFKTGSSATNRMRIDNGGSVAIGNFTPSGTPTGDYRSLEIGRQGNTITGAPWKSNLYLTCNATITAGSSAFTYRYASEVPARMDLEDGNVTFYNAAAGTVGDTISWNTRMIINSSGNVGIGTTSPSSYNSAGYNLVIAGTGNSGLTIASGTSNDSNILFADGTSGADAYRGILRYNHATDSMQFFTDASERARLDSSGNLLLGTTSQAGNGQLSIGIDDSNGGRIALTNLRTALFDGDSLGRIEFVSNDTTSTGVKAMIIAKTEDVSANTNIQFHTGGTLTERLRITSAGNVGIGTTSPGSKLHVKGDFVSIEDPSGGFKMELSADADPVTIMSDNLTGAAYGQIAFVAGNGSGSNDQERMRIDSSGSLIVGTATVAAANAAADNFVIKGEGAAVGLTISQNSNSGTGTIFFGDAASSAAAGFRYNHNTGDMAVSFEDDITFANNGAERMRITSAGNVGIGCSPTFKLDVLSNGTSLRLNSSDANGSYVTWSNNGTANGFIGSGYHLWSSPNNIATTFGIRAETRLDLGIQSSVHMTILNSGNVGIGTTSPSVALDVTGEISASDDINTTGKFFCFCCRCRIKIKINF